MRVIADVRPLMGNVQRIAGTLVLIAECAIFGYALLMSFLLTGWMESDSFAARATEVDWWIEAGKRMTVTTIGAALFSIVAYFVNRHALRWTGIIDERIPVFAAIGAFALLVGAAIAGAVTFAITRPFM